LLKGVVLVCERNGNVVARVLASLQEEHLSLRFAVGHARDHVHDLDVVLHHTLIEVLTTQVGVAAGVPATSSALSGFLNGNFL
jgi:hypothetical protein